MKAIAYLISNSDEVEEAKRLNLPKVPPTEIVEEEIHFPIMAMSIAFKVEGGTKIKAMVNNQIFILKYQDDVWDRIVDHFKHI